MNERHRALRGFSLIELMIAVTIGLVLSLLIGQIFINSRQVFASTDNLSRLQENARYALALLSRGIRSSAYMSDPRVARITLFPVATTPSLTGTDGASGAPDQFTVRFQGSGNGTGTADGTIQNCIGTPRDYNASIVDTYFIKNDPNNNNEPTLYCNTVTTACVEPPTTPTTCFPLVPGVESMQILYGEDIGASPLPNLDGSIDRWVTAGNVTNWDNVLSVRISLLLRSADRVAQTVDSKSYNLVGTTFTAPGTDTRLRRVFTTVVNLRNRTQ